MSETDTSLEDFAEGMKLLGEKDLNSAAERFEKVIAETDGRHLRDRARQFLAMCRSHLSQDESVEDLFLAAVLKKNDGQLDEAMRLCEQDGSDDEKFVYLKASIEALAGKGEKALLLLEKAIKSEPKNRVHAFHDPDFQSLRGQEGFTALINPPQSGSSSSSAGSSAGASPAADPSAAGSPIS